MDLPARPEDPLAQPTRARLFEALAELSRPAGTEELASALGLHPNGVRLHLERLVEAGLVVRRRDRRPRGRPRDMWLTSPEALPAGRPPNTYAHLGQWLARATPPEQDSLIHVETTGEEIGREMASRAAEKGEAGLYATLAAQGFQPRREAHVPGRLTYRLCNCPYREVARENATVVCALHRGITRGLLAELDSASTLSAFVPGEPNHAGCLVELSGAVAAEGLRRMREAGG